MLAQRLPGILPPMTDAEALESAAIQSLASGGFDIAAWRRRPFRAPHHTASAVAIVGGGGNPRPGEISLAHHGVLFLDELPEFSRNALEALREPLESGVVVLSRARRVVEFPARFLLVAAMNPCPCGWQGDARRRCRCTAEQVRRYRAKLSGPLLDRIDIHVEVRSVPPEELLDRAALAGEGSLAVSARVRAARARQWSRQGRLNAHLSAAELAARAPLDRPGRALLARAIGCLGLSARGCDRVIKLARTIADLQEEPDIRATHVSEAIALRALDRAPEQE